MKPDWEIRKERDAHRREARLLNRVLKKRKRVAHGEPPTKEKRAFWRKGHEYLETALEMTKRRIEIFRNAGGEVQWFDESDSSTIDEIQPAICQGCAEPHLIGWSNLEGHWHHNVKSKGGRRCDCAACALYVCIPWHQIYHNRVIAVRQVG